MLTLILKGKINSIEDESIDDNTLGRCFHLSKPQGCKFLGLPYNKIITMIMYRIIQVVAAETMLNNNV